MILRKNAIIIVAVAACSFLLGVWYTGRTAQPDVATAAGPRILRYICPMHPQYISDRPGTAPCCGMRLEPVYENDTASSPSGNGAPPALPPGVIMVSPERQQLAGVRTGTVERATRAHTLRAPGRVIPDERLVFRINAALDGWVRETYSNSTGSIVHKDERLATVYSPDYRNAQTAYLVALGQLDRVREALRETPEQIAAVENSVQLYRDSLRNLGMGDRQLEEMNRIRQQTENIHLYSPATGFVLARNVSAGQRFVKGEELFRVADLSRVWILADLFEHESRHVRPGQTVKVLYQGRAFQAQVSEVLPQFDPDSRTLKVRLEVDNPGYLLRPGMFVDVEFPIKLPPAVTIPADAMIDSGLRKTVYVDLGNGYFEPRIIETGWRFGGRVEVTRGLQPGERIVVAGNFLLDSESRMKAAAAGIQAPAKDPVCGMDVDRVKAKAAGRTSEYQGATYYFCADQCKRKFDSNPAQYAGESPGQPKQAQGPAVDPVCGMEVDRADAKTARRTSQYRGTTYYFCSDHCKKQFDKEPSKYLKKPSAAGEAHI